jgi:hypothetical protein
MRERGTGHGAGGTGTAVECLSPRRAVRLRGRSCLQALTGNCGAAGAAPSTKLSVPELLPCPAPRAPCPVSTAPRPAP